MKYLFILLSLFPFAVLHAADTGILYLTSSAETEVAPNMFSFNFSLRGSGYTSKRAMSRLNEKSANVYSIFQSAFNDTYFIKSRGMSLRKDRRYDKKQKQWLDSGYIAQITYSISGNDFNKIPLYLDALSRMEIESISNIQFYSSKRDSILNSLYAEALTKARNRAAIILDKNGFKQLFIKKITALPADYIRFAGAAPRALTAARSKTPEINAEPQKIKVSVKAAIVYTSKK